ncbi:hypothetical protein FPQ18DRAFT_309448 [Pyronema domesticum]|nr:hypothetical protein FPQ18DRAFT_309448 [Pyronema domesticum]
MDSDRPKFLHRAGDLIRRHLPQLIFHNDNIAVTPQTLTAHMTDKLYRSTNVFLTVLGNNIFGVLQSLISVQDRGVTVRSYISYPSNVFVGAMNRVPVRQNMSPIRPLDKSVTIQQELYGIGSLKMESRINCNRGKLGTETLRQSRQMRIDVSVTLAASEIPPLDKSVTIQRESYGNGSLKMESRIHYSQGKLGTETLRQSRQGRTVVSVLRVRASIVAIPAKRIGTQKEHKPRNTDGNK